MKILYSVLFCVVTASAQQYSVSTIAGSALPVTPAPAISSSIGNTNSVARDAAGNIYFSSGESVFKVDFSGVLTLVAGNSTSGYSGDGGLAVNAQLSNPWGVAVDGSGNLYIADELNNRIRRVSAAGIMTTVAGNGTAGLSGDGGSAVDAQLHNPLNVMVDSSDNLYIADYFNNRVRKVSPAGIIVTIAGGGAATPGDGGLATAATIAGPAGMALDAAGNLFVADRSGMRVRKISANGIISTVAGNGTSGFSGDGGLAIDAEMYLPSDVAVDAAGNLYIADFNNNRIRKVSSAGITTISSTSTLNGPSGVALDSAGSLYVADRFDSEIQKISTAGSASIVAGNGTAHFSGDGGPAASAEFNNVTGVAVDQFGNLFFADQLNARVREVSPAGVVTTFAGGGMQTPNGVAANTAKLVYPAAVAFDPSGNLYIADSGAQQIYKVSPAGIITIVAGNGTQGTTGDGGPATSAELVNPSGVAADGSGNVYILTAGSNTTSMLALNAVRKVSPDGTISTLIPAIVVTSGVAFTQTPWSPTALAMDASGNLYVEEIGFGAGARASGTIPVQILKISPSGTTTTISGAVTPTTINGEILSGAMTVDVSGDIYLIGGTSVQRISPAGTTASFSYANGPLVAQGAATDASGKLYVAEQYSVVLLQPASGSLVSSPVAISAVIDAASESPGPVSPGKIVAIYGTGLGPAQGVSNQPASGLFGTRVSSSSVTFNGTPAPILYTSATQIIAVVPYEVTGTSAQVVATYQGQVSATFTASVAASAPNLFTRNQTGAGQAAAINDVDGTLNTAANPVAIGAYISLFATGEGQTAPTGLDGRLGGANATYPLAGVTATVGGLPAIVQYSGGIFGDVAGIMQVNVQIPAGVTPGGYVPVVLTVGTASTNAGTWIAVAGN